MTKLDVIYTTRSGRGLPIEWELLYGEPMSFLKSWLFVLKLSTYVPLWRAKVGLSGWLARISLPFTWIILLALGQGSFILLGAIGFIALLASALAFEFEKGMEGRLITVFGWAIPLVLVISPLLALFIMGGGNSSGLGRKSTCNDWTSLSTLDQARSGRTTYKKYQ